MICFAQFAQVAGQVGGGGQGVGVVLAQDAAAPVEGVAGQIAGRRTSPSSRRSLARSSGPPILWVSGGRPVW
jgi:hypothetical protein